MRSSHWSRAFLATIPPISNVILFIALSFAVLVNIHHNVILAQSHGASPAISLASSPEASESELHAPINLTDDSIVHDVTISPEGFTNTESTVALESVTQPTTESPALHYMTDGIELSCDKDQHCPEHMHCLGSTCQCLPDYCAHTGTCILTQDRQVACLCQTGFTGPRCEHAPQTCDSVDCLNGATCLTDVDGFAHCQCALGFHGTLPLAARGSSHTLALLIH